MKDEREEFGALLVQTSAEVCAPDGRFELVEPGTDGLDNMVAASIGMSGPGLRGALVLMARISFFGASYPLRGAGPPDDEALADWAGEMSNLILGGLRNRLAVRGIDFSLSTPTVVHGLHLRVSRRDEPMIVVRGLRVGDERVTVHCEVRRDGGLGLLAPNAPPSTASPVGETLLF